MTEYTPTTGKVRNCYSSGRLVLDNDGTSPSERETEFDRWLDQVKATAWDSAVASMVHEDGTPVEIVANRNPYRK